MLHPPAKPPCQAVFFDRDGTLNEDTGYPSRPDQIRLFPGIPAALSRLEKAGLQLFLFTNQSGIGRGWYTMEDVRRCNEKLIREIGLERGFADICIAPETPGEPPVYRKPSPRFLRESLERFNLRPEACWMVGDRLSDWQAGWAGGLQVARIGSSEPFPPVPADFQSQTRDFPSVTAFVDFLL